MKYEPLIVALQCFCICSCMPSLFYVINLEKLTAEAVTVYFAWPWIWNPQINLFILNINCIIMLKRQHLTLVNERDFVNELFLFSRYCIRTIRISMYYWQVITSDWLLYVFAEVPCYIYKYTEWIFLIDKQSSEITS